MGWKRFSIVNILNSDNTLTLLNGLSGFSYFYLYPFQLFFKKEKNSNLTIGSSVLFFTRFSQLGGPHSLEE